MIFMPESPRTATVAVIAHTEKTVTVRFPEKNDAFREIVKACWFQWDYSASHWHRAIKPTIHGTTRDRAIEMACRLLAGRFSIEAPDEFHPAILAGAYEPEHTRWIDGYRGDYLHDWFIITWRRPDDLYRAAMRLAAARYAKPGVAVYGDHFAEILDFAERYDFRLTPEAQALLAEFRQRHAGAVRVTVAAMAEPEPVKAQLKPEKLAIPAVVEVDHDLRD